MNFIRSENLAGLNLADLLCRVPEGPAHLLTLSGSPPAALKILLRLCLWHLLRPLASQAAQGNAALDRVLPPRRRGCNETNRRVPEPSAILRESAPAKRESNSLEEPSDSLRLSAILTSSRTRRSNQ